jgi:hypothetical protein
VPTITVYLPNDVRFSLDESARTHGASAGQAAVGLIRAALKAGLAPLPRERGPGRPKAPVKARNAPEATPAAPAGDVWDLGEGAAGGGAVGQGGGAE